MDDMPAERRIRSSALPPESFGRDALSIRLGTSAVVRSDNVYALKKLGRTHAGAVKCAYIDPPYNNNELYTHYDDRQSHVEWLEGVLEVCSLIYPLLTEDGSLWVSIDDYQVHYLKVALDELFGRVNFITTIVWEQRTTRENRKVVSNNHEYILVYAKDHSLFKKNRGLLEWDDAVLSRYKNPDADVRGLWQSVTANVQAGHATPAQFYEVVAPNGRRHSPPKGRCWVYSEPRMKEEIVKGNVWFGRDGNSVPRIKRFLSDARKGFTPHTLWKADEVGTNDSAKKHLLELFPEERLFDTPKPEALIHRVLQIASREGDIVLDAYLGSGTTAAVALKTNRRFIGIECGEHAISLCASRLEKVLAGERGGISDAVGWFGGVCDFEVIDATGKEWIPPRRSLREVGTRRRRAGLKALRSI